MAVMIACPRRATHTQWGFSYSGDKANTCPHTGHVVCSPFFTVSQCRSWSAGAACPVHPTIRSSNADSISAGLLTVPNGPRDTSLCAKMSG